MIARFLRNRRGATAIEYAMIAAFIGAVIVTAVGALGTNVGAKFDSIVAAWN